MKAQPILFNAQGRSFSAAANTRRVGRGCSLLDYIRNLILLPTGFWDIK